jgi:nicotinate-nucleotide adenylyltransferase
VSAIFPIRALGRSPRKRVGLFGGSFNPAHEGHAYIAREALKRLQLDEVWLLVSPQNPLKTEDGMAPLAERLARARAICGAGGATRPIRLWLCADGFRPRASFG